MCAVHFAPKGPKGVQKVSKGSKMVLGGLQERERESLIESFIEGLLERLIESLKESLKENLRGVRAMPCRGLLFMTYSFTL